MDNQIKVESLHDVFWKNRIKFCALCGERVGWSVPKGDNLNRAICSNKNCNWIHYLNPKVVVAGLIYFNDEILLAKRNIEPRKGLWTVPGGYLEVGESLDEGVAREALEETGVSAIWEGLVYISELIEIGEIYFFYKAKWDEKIRPHKTKESMDVKFFKMKDIPWTEIAFYPVHRALSMRTESRGMIIEQLDINKWRKYILDNPPHKSPPQVF